MSAQDDACVTGGGEVPENIFNMLQDQCAAHSTEERRADPRQHWPIVVTLYVVHPVGEAGEAMKLEVVQTATHDFTRRGFGCFINDAMEVGTMVRVHFISLKGEPAIYGVIRSCSHVAGTVYRVSVEFSTA